MLDNRCLVSPSHRPILDDVDPDELKLLNRVQRSPVFVLGMKPLSRQNLNSFTDGIPPYMSQKFLAAAAALSLRLKGHAKNVFSM